MAGCLTWKHHSLIQALLSRGPMEEKDFCSIFSAVTGKNPRSHRQLFNDCLLHINKELTYVQLEMRACCNQYDGKVYYGIVNNVVDEQAKLGTKYSVPQIAFYKGVIEAIVQDTTAQGSISNIGALNVRLESQFQNGTGSESLAGPSNIPPAFRNFSISQKEKTLNELVQDRWLCSTPDGNIGLGVRSFFDLRSWFRNNDVPTCDSCNEAGVKAEVCQNESCNVRIHSYCLKKKFSQKRVDRACPGCGNAWLIPNTELVEEDESVEPSEPTQSQAAPLGSSRKRKLKSCKTEVDTDTAGAGSSQRVPDLRRSTRKSSRLR